jgi:hypothetical protein
MSDCCTLPRPAEVADDRCHRCGEKGRKAPRETLLSLLKPEARERLRDVPYFFDRTPSCGVVYFCNGAQSYFQKDDLTVRVSLKETASPITLCYCFGHTLESARAELLATGSSTVAKRIAAEVQLGNCSCIVKNPSGQCCLGDVNRAIQQIQTELSEEPVGAREGGKES